MADIFVSHVEEDSDVALEIANGLETAGYTTWHYERDSVPGVPYLLQTGEAIAGSRAFILLISPHSLESREKSKISRSRCYQGRDVGSP